MDPINKEVNAKSVFSKLHDWIMGKRDIYEDPKYEQYKSELVNDIHVPSLREAIAYNETRGEKEPYSYYRFSGDPNLKDALGRYQITEGELDTYGKLYLGKNVTRDEFLSDPKIQDTYIDSKIKYGITERKLSVPEILVTHTGGLGNLSPETLAKREKQYPGYLTEGLKKYNEFNSQYALSRGK